MISSGAQKFLLILAIATVGVLIYDFENSDDFMGFEQWKAEHRIQYRSEFENNYRRKIFQDNLAKITKHNSNPLNTYQMGLNQFSALTEQEFVQQYLSDIKVKENTVLEIQKSVTDEDVSVEAGDIDWTQQGAVGPVKNQGQCGAAWVFATTGPLQGLTKISQGTLKILSDQQLIDCTGAGCRGGFADTGYKYVKQHGICTAQEYPYHGSPQTCQKPDGSFKISGYTQINGCNDLANAIQKGPVTVLVDATNWSTYRSGILSNCGVSLNHAVTLVGQIQENWKIQNSWGASWGENGFIRLAKGNTCGICQNGIIPFK